MDKRAPDNRSIGVFDSGMGGLTAVRRLHALMPKENIIYFGDTSRVPYGTRGRDTIVKYARQDVAFLRQFDLKAIVIACNTVSSVALDLLAEENNIPIIGTVEPACRRAMTMTKNGRVGVIGTAATMRSGAYEKYLHKKDGTLRLFTQACPLFVPLVENGRVHRGDIVIETVAAEYLAPLKETGVDTLILGCTHYPLLEEVISDYMGPDVTLIDSGAELKSDLLKVGHHGAATSSGAEFLREVSPQWAVISVGADNDFGHPADETLKRLSSAGANVLRTDKNGTITVNSDGKTITLTAERNFKSITADEPVGETYIGNKNTKKFHRQSCHTLPAEKNRVELKSRDEAIKQGYVPCKNCNP